VAAKRPDIVLGFPVDIVVEASGNPKSGYRKDATSGELFQRVWFQNAREIAEKMISREPFLVAVAVAHSYEEVPQ
jgi:hypothetical protein